MKKASIISIGNEILSGQTIDTNAAYLSEQLLSLDIPVMTSYTIGDEIDLIVRTLNYAAKDADIILITGGLGPTGDDLTRQALAKYLGTELQLRDDLLQHIQTFFDRRSVPMSETNKQQAYIPAGTEPLKNTIGTAPGILAETGGKIFAVMPGVPVEMKKMFEEMVVDRLKNFAPGQAVVIKKLRCFGTGESNIAKMLGNLMQRGRNPLINLTASGGVITLHIIAIADKREKAEILTEDDEQMLLEMLGDLVFGSGDETLPEVVGEKLAQLDKTLSLAESCTGGLIAKMITDVPGASRYFTQGWVTYSNQAKINELGVETDLIEQYGAVSEQVAESMAKGARHKAKTDFSIAVTGIAGPIGATEQKALGLVYISVDSETGTETKRFVFSHDRAFMLNLLRLILNHLT
jgi:nicotinamide-nucleotide amidase